MLQAGRMRTKPIAERSSLPEGRLPLYSNRKLPLIPPQSDGSPPLDEIWRNFFEKNRGNFRKFTIRQP